MRLRAHQRTFSMYAPGAHGELKPSSIRTTGRSSITPKGGNSSSPILRMSRSSNARTSMSTKRNALAQQLRVWRYGHDDAERLGASSRRGASRTLVEVGCAVRPCSLRAVRAESLCNVRFACGPWRRRSLQAGWICWSTDRGYLQSSWRPPCGPPQVAAQQHCAFVPWHTALTRTYQSTHTVSLRYIHVYILCGTYMCTKYIHMYYTIRLIYQSSRRTPSRMRRLHASSRAVATACCGCMPTDATRSRMPLSRPRANCVRSFGT